MSCFRFAVLSAAVRRRLAAILGWLRCREYPQQVRNTIVKLTRALAGFAVAHSAGEPPGTCAVALSYADSDCSNVL